MSEPPGVTTRSDDQLSLSGELIFDFAMIMQAMIQGQLADVPNVNVDLSAVKALDAAGLQVLVSLQKTLVARGGDITVTATNDVVDAALLLMGAEDLFTDEKEAA